MEQEKETIVVIGFGWVGQANAIALAKLGHEVFFFDTGSPANHYADRFAEDYERIRRIKDPLAKDGPNTVYIVCVGDRVSDEGVQDISYIESALAALKGARGVVVLRSTILPNTLARLSYDFYVPEFLHEVKAVEESITPHFLVVGTKKSGLSEPSFFAIWEERALRTFRGTPDEASHIKYLSNLWNAIRIAFVNEYGCSIAEPSTPEAVAKIDRVMHFMFENAPYRRFGRSYDGHCLPKDSRAYARFAENAGRHTFLLKGMIDSNNAHQKIEGKFGHIKKWFSEWERRDGSGWVALRELGRSVRRNVSKPVTALRRRQAALRTRDIQDSQ